MNFKLWGEIVGMIALVESFLIYLSNKRDRILVLKFVGDVLWVVNYLLLGGFTGAILNGLSMLRELLFYQRDKRPFFAHTAWLFVFWALTLVSSALTYAGPISLLPMIGNLLSTAGFYCLRTGRARIILTASYAFWLSYAVALANYSAIVSASIALLSILVGALRACRKRATETKE